MHRFSRLTAVLILTAFVPPVSGLGPTDVILVTNKNEPASRDVAEHYRTARGVPAENLIELDLPTGEDISRADYDAKLAGPLRAVLKDRKEAVKCLLSVYGVPLRVGHGMPTPAQKEEQEAAAAKVKEREAEVKRLEEAAKDDPKAKDELATARRELDSLRQREAALSFRESQAAVDSELMLLWWEGYDLRRWQLNPLYWQMPADIAKGKPPVLLTCRLDGPTPAIAKRLVDDAIAVEKKGLTGEAYIDARGIKYDPKGGDPGYGYGGYDESMREAACLLEKAGLPTTVDNDEPVFKPGECPDCAIYCGWYSHANYVDSCKLVRGSVAWHLASSEAVSLRRKDAKYWCKNLLEKGAAATLGPVAEPYTIGFPKPAEFFGTLLTGEYTLAETYGRTVLFASWMGCLVGDPLYHPFKANAKLKPADVTQSPKGGRFLLERR